MSPSRPPEAANLLRAACASRRRDADLALAGCELTALVLDGLHAERLQGDGSVWQGCDFAGARLDAARLRQARLVDCRLAGSRWQACDASGLQADGSVWAGAVVEDCCFDGAVLTGADFHAARLTDTRFARAQLDGACFDGVQADGTSWRGASAVGARFAGARLAGADFRGADLRDAVFDGAHLEGADFRGATLDGAHLAAARCSGARWDAASVAVPGAAAAAPPLDAAHLEALLTHWLAGLPQGRAAAREPMALLEALLRRADLPAGAPPTAPLGAAGAAVAPLLDLIRALQSGEALPQGSEAQWQALATSLFPALVASPDAPGALDWEALARLLARTPPPGTDPAPDGR